MKRTEAFIIAMVMWVSAMSMAIIFTANAAYAASTVPECIDGIYQIGTADELYWFAEYVNAGNADTDAVLTADIVVNDGDVAGYDGTSDNDWAEWTPIGYYNSSGDLIIYTGIFDGQGHVISGLYFNDSSASGVGLFGVIGEGGEISNVGVENSYIYSGPYDDDKPWWIGGVCGYNYYGTITSCYNIGKVIGGRSVGGVCGQNEGGTIISCYNTGEVSGAGDVGGICGYNCGYGIITGCYNTGSVSGSGDDTGGVCGRNGGGGGSTIENCYNAGSVSSSGDDTGGVCGGNCSYGTIENCYNAGSVNSSGDNTGGVCGQNNGYGIITGCYNTGSISSSGDDTGGVCGYNYGSGTIENCYNTGSVSGSSSYTGGVCGYNIEKGKQLDDRGIITNCYYLDSTAVGGIDSSDVSGSAEAKTAAEFESGEVCYLLNGSSSDDVVWYQTLGRDSYPLLSEALIVYYNSGSEYYYNIASAGDADTDDSDDTAAGDLNGDGKVSTKDAVLALQMAVGQISTDTAADVNGDGKVSTKDAVLILQYAVGQIDSF